MRNDLLPVRLIDKFSRLNEECAELIIAISKLERFGERATDPQTGIEYDNLKTLFDEMNDVEHAINEIRKHITQT